VCTDALCLSCQSDDDCDSDFFCLKHGGCSLLQGACTHCNPEILCTLEYDPVCGCDDSETYGNPCEAIRECVSSFDYGECEIDDDLPVSCESDSDCGNLFYCSRDSCDSNLLGVCIEIPIGLCPDVELSVCGCDGETYKNSCFAAKARVDVGSIGDCDLTYP
jgi:hypothetical protein